MGYAYNLDVEFLKRLIFRVCGFCGVCECVLRDGGHRDPNAASVDRIYPSGGYTRDNVTVICFACNLSKGAMNPEMMKNYLRLLDASSSWGFDYD